MSKINRIRRAIREALPNWRIDVGNDEGVGYLIEVDTQIHTRVTHTHTHVVARVRDAPSTQTQLINVTKRT